MSPYATSLFPDLLKILSDNSDEVVFQGLSVLAEIVNSTQSKGLPSAGFVLFVNV